MIWRQNMIFQLRAVQAALAYYKAHPVEINTLIQMIRISKPSMGEPKLHLDADDEVQLSWALTQPGLFTHNIRDFINISDQHPDHAGILLGHRRSYSLSNLSGF